MTPEQRQLVRDSWRQVVPVADAAAQMFYDRLFDTDPASRALFAHVDMRAQGHKLMAMLDRIVRSLDALDAVAPQVAALGRRHVGYGVVDRDYDAVGAALLWTLEQAFGAAFTPELRDAWAAAYAIAAGVMRGAAAQAPTAA